MFPPTSAAKGLAVAASSSSRSDAGPNMASILMSVWDPLISTCDDDGDGDGVGVVLVLASVVLGLSEEGGVEGSIRKKKVEDG